MRPKLFIASSSENLDVAYALQESLEPNAEITVWSQGVFQPSRFTLEDLVIAISSFDFAVFVFVPDDITQIRSTERTTVRDNVVFELGLFIGGIGRDRCFIIVPKDSQELHLPSDLIGLNPLAYESSRVDKNLVAALGPASNRIRKAMETISATNPKSVLVKTSEFVQNDHDDTDALSILETWFGSLPGNKIIVFGEADELLKLKPGTTERLIEQAVKKWDWVRVRRRGKTTIQFE